jgi:hypothetical protein
VVVEALMVAQFWTHFRASMGGAVAAQQGFPEVVGRSESSDADGGDVVVALPDGIETGDLLIVAVACSNTTEFTWPDGWTGLTNAARDDGSGSSRMEIRYRVVDGSEEFSGSEDAITVTTGAAASASLGWRISDFHAETEPQFLGIPGATFSGQPNLGAHNPSGWDVEKALWIAIVCVDGNRAVTHPTTHPLARRRISSGLSATGITLAAAELKAAVPALDQGAWNLDPIDSWVVGSIAIRPAAA